MKRKNLKANSKFHIVYKLLLLVIVGLIVLVYVGSILIPKFAKDSKFLAAIYASVLINLANYDRKDTELLPLNVNPLLSLAAENKAKDMARRGYFSHNTPEGILPWHWIKEAGYDYLYAGENLAVNFDDSKDVEQAWMNSPTHKANILNYNFTDIGIGMATGTWNGKEAIFVVQMFGSPKK